MIENTKVREIITKEITDNDLNISPDLVIERYGFELIGLKDWNDYRKFSRNWIKMSKLLDKIFAITLKAGTGLKTEGNSFEEGQTFSLKIATKNEIGGVKQGENIEITDDGTINGSAPYRHPSGNGNTHLPSNGATGQFIKWLSAGAGQWTAITWGDITGKPSTFTPSSHTHSKSQITDFAHTHSKSQITDFAHTHSKSQITDFAHTHTKSQITDFPVALKNPTSLTIQTNGVSQGAYDGETAKTINITAANIGAEPAFTKNNAFNKNYGTTTGTTLEGSKLAEILGIPYGGVLNNTSAKTVGTAYYDNTTKKTYKCTVANSLNYADSTKYEAISNNDLLAKLQNLPSVYIIETGVSGKQWYRKYSDGYKEQGGIGYANNDTKIAILNFLISFSNTNYSCVVAGSWESSTSGGWDYVHSKTVSSCKVVANRGDINYYACGY